ncbi:hypothetical protein J8J40_34055, partial [Mycobacterium tuberculosis]|nr:hypothetical protein [Mycobacterium tuberculosis]
MFSGSWIAVIWLAFVLAAPGLPGADVAVCFHGTGGLASPRSQGTVQCRRERYCASDSLTITSGSVTA